MGSFALQLLLAGLAADAGVMTEVCPLDGTHFQREGHLSSGATGLRLDLRPIGRTLEPLVRCPRCQFVPGPEEPRREQLEELRELVSSATYVADLHGHSDHILRARILDVIRPASPAAAFEWMRASWELEDGHPEEWRDAMEHALSAFARLSFARYPQDLEDRRTGKLMQVELLRRLGRFVEARAALQMLRAEKDLQQGIATKLIGLESELVDRLDSSPQPLPVLGPLDPSEEDPGLVAATHLAGYASFNRSFTIKRADFGSINLQAHALHLSIHARQERTLDSAWWWNFTRDGEPQFDWQQFLAAHAKAEKLVERNPWLTEWKAAVPGRHIELQLAGLKSNTETQPDFFLLPPWRDAGFERDPVVQLLLREGAGETCADVFLDEGGGGIVNSVSDHCTPNHWVTAKALWFHPKSLEPTYLRIDPDGHWERRVIGMKR